MASHPHREGVNPLRPYYIPPSIGEPSDLPPKTGPNPLSHGAGSTGRYASKARDIFSDIDYSDYIAEPSSSVVRTVKDLVDELLWKYTSVLMAQPFEVAKTILQVRSQDDPGALHRPQAAETPLKQLSRNNSRYGVGLASIGTRRMDPAAANTALQQHAESDSDPDEPDYFTSNVPSTPTPSRSRARRRSSSAHSTPQTAAPSSTPSHQLELRQPDSILEVVGQIWSKEGAWGVWKGSNASFIYTVLQSLMENWSRSLLSALFNVPDLGLREDVDRLVDIASPYPWASLCVAAAAAVATGLLLSPLDIVRTRLLVTPTGRQPRHTLPILRSLPSYFCPSSIFLPTMLHSLVHPVLSLSTPLVLRTRFMINQDVNPTTFSAAKFCSSTVALLVKLPLETVLRRGQVAVLNTPAYLHASGASDGPKGKAKVAATPAALESIVVPGKYDGVFGTMHKIVKEEGSRPVVAGKAAAGQKKGKAKIAETVYRRGQGLEGLWRGWKVSWWGLVGLWAAGVVGGGGDGEF